MRSNPRGFSLVELMIVLAIIAVIAIIAYPAYLSSVQESRRSDAHAALTAIAAQQERYFSDNTTYVVDLTTLGYAAATPASPEGYYQITAAAGASGIATSYALSAAPQGAQAGDTDCAAITLSSIGQKNPVSCW